MVFVQTAVQRENAEEKHQTGHNERTAKDWRKMGESSIIPSAYTSSTSTIVRPFFIVKFILIRKTIIIGPLYKMAVPFLHLMPQTFALQCR